MRTEDLACPECDSLLRLKSRPAPGKRVRCPRCEAVFRVPADEPDDEEERPSPRTSAVRARDDDDGERVSRRRPRRPRDGDRHEEDARSRPRGNLGLVLGLAGGGLALALAAVVAVFLMMGRPASPVAKGPRDKPPEDPPPVEAPADPFAERRRGEVVFAEWVDDAQGTVPAPLPDGPDRPLLMLDAGAHTSTIFKAIPTPDGKAVVTCGLDKSVRVWDVASGRTTTVIRLPAGAGPDGSIFSAALARDARTLAVGGLTLGGEKDGFLVYLIDLATGRLQRTLAGPTAPVTSLDFSPDGALLASSGHDRTVRIHDVKSGKQLHAFPGHANSVRQVRFAPDGKAVATASNDATARIFHLGGGEPAVFRGHTIKVVSVAWSPDGTRLASNGDDNHIRVWDRAGKQLSAFAMTPDPKKETIHCTAMAFLPGGDEILYGGVSFGGQVGIIDLKQGKYRLRFDKHTNTVMDARLAAGGTLAVTTGGDEGETYVWETRTGKVVRKLAGGSRTICGVGWSADGKSLAWGTVNRDIARGRAPLERALKLDMASSIRPLPPAAEYARSRTSADGFLLEQLDFFNVGVRVKGKPAWKWSPPAAGERVYCMTMLPGGRAAVGTAFGVYLLDLPARKAIRRFTGHQGLVWAIAPSPDGTRFVTGSNDQTMCVWSPEQDRPLLSLFVAGQDWIAWSPEGYYACSATGERLMGWQVNRGAKELAAFFPAAQFRKSLYDPPLVRQAIPKGGVAEVLRARPGGALSVDRVLPPEVAITSPADGTRQAGGMVIEAEARSVGDNAVTALRLIVDGRPWKGIEGIRPVKAPRPGKVRAKWNVDLPPGRHHVTVQAESAVSRRLAMAVNVENTSRGDGKPPALYILAVGVSAYPGDMRLNYAASDAALMTRTFKERHRGSFSKVEARVLLDAEATRINVARGLGWLREVMTPSDVCIVFFAGHGMRDPGGNFYFVPVDVNVRDPAGTCVPGEAVKRIMGDLPGRLIFMLDACHSGAAAEKGETADDLTRDLITEDYGILVMSSSMGDECSMESSEIRAGFFTKALTEGLEGRADFNGDRVIELHELDFYTTRRVQEMTRGEQNPITGRPPWFQTFPVAKP